MPFPYIPDPMYTYVGKSYGEGFVRQHETSAAKLDNGFVRLLQSMSFVERNPYFCSSTCDKSRISYPENLVVVVSPASEAPPPAEGEVRVTKISEAIMHCAFRAIDGDGTKFSILVHEGVYFNPNISIPPTCVPEYQIPKDFTIEIIGTKNVRLVFLGDLEPPLFHVGVSVTVRNVLLYNRNFRTGEGTIGAVERAQGSLIDVKVNSPASPAFTSSHRGTRVRLDRCVAERSFYGLFAHKEGEMIAENCRINEYTAYSIKFQHENTHMTVTKSVIMRSKPMYVMLGAKGVVTNCFFFGVGDEESKAVAITSGGILGLSDCSFENFQMAIHLEDIGSKLKMSRCRIGKSVYLGFEALVNPSATIKESELGCPLILSNCYNKKGFIEFKKNKIIPNLFGISAPEIQHDKESANSFKHDMKSVKICQVKTGCLQFPLKYNRSAFMKTVETDKPTNMGIDTRLYSQGLWKMCGKCHAMEVVDGQKRLEGPVKKFKYCTKCDRVAYCSKECQVADWDDHKLYCPQLQFMWTPSSAPDEVD